MNRMKTEVIEIVKIKDKNLKNKTMSLINHNTLNI